MKRHYPQPRSPNSTTRDGVMVATAGGVDIADAALERLEELDDAIFAALDGDAAALDRSFALWKRVRNELDQPLVAESRAEYARRARTVWGESRTAADGSLGRAFAALEVLGLVEGQ